MRHKHLIFLFIAGMVLLDQITKYLADSMIETYNPLKVLPFFQLVNVKNEGAAFGQFKFLGNEVFIAIALIAISVIIYLLIKDKDSTWSLSLILSGAVGNLIDRLYYGHVRDFIDVFIGRFHWPAFNIADSCLTAGILLLVVVPLFRRGAVPSTHGNAS